MIFQSEQQEAEKITPRQSMDSKLSSVFVSIWPCRMFPVILSGGRGHVREYERWKFPHQQFPVTSFDLVYFGGLFFLSFS